jgi:hypothetical protein
MGFAPEIRVISERDYGLQERGGQRQKLAEPKRPGKERSSPEALTYNPDCPFPISACAVGKTIRYDNYSGTYGIIDDPFVRG